MKGVSARCGGWLSSVSTQLLCMCLVRNQGYDVISLKPTSPRASYRRLQAEKSHLCAPISPHP